MVGDRRRRAILPRLIRLRDAPAYLGMDRNRFQSEVRPGLTEVPIGVQGIAVDRLELDAWVDDYIARNGRPARKGKNTWDARQYRASSNEMGAGISTNTSVGGAFAKALEQIASKKQSDTSQS